MMVENPPESPAAFPLQGRDQVALHVLRSVELLAGRQEVLIDHAGQIYRLRVTRSGKLILQK